MTIQHSRLKLFGNHVSLLSKFLTVFILFLSGFTSASSGDCQDLFKTTPATSIYAIPDRTWRDTPGDLFMGFRSNAPHFWHWATALQNPLFTYKGIVVGDPHLLNFGDIVLANGKFVYGLVDLDDGGRNASLFADFLRYYVGNQIAPFKSSGKDLFQAYMDGLAGKTVERPKYLRNLEHTYQDFEKSQAKYIHEMTKGDRFSNAARVFPLSSAPREVIELFERTRADLEKNLPNSKILDIAYRLKDTGGSQGLPRFWYLVEQDGARHIIEFKMLTQPAVANYSAQPTSRERFKDLSNQYRPEEEVLGPYQQVQTEIATFLMRERLAHFIDMDPAKLKTKKQIHEAQELSLYLANQMGQWQGRQNGGKELLAALLQNKKKAFEAFSQSADSYIDLMKEEH